MPISKWLKKLIDRANGPDGGEGADGIVDSWDLFLRAGRLVRQAGFIPDLTALVERFEATERESQSQEDRLKMLRYPNLMGKNWKSALHAWMQEVMDAFLGFHVDVPEPLTLNRNQRRLLKKYGLWLFFVPAVEESLYPTHMIKLDWNRCLSGTGVQPLSLPGCWIAFEIIQKPNYEDGKYPDDKLMVEIGMETRFVHPYSDKGEGDDLVVDILPKAAKELAPLGGTTRIQSARVFNFMGNLFNWLSKYTEDSFPDLGATNSVEWCEERYGSQNALIVGDSAHRGLSHVYYYWCDCRYTHIAFRFLVQFENAATKVVA